MDVIYRKQRLALTRFWGDNRLCLRATEPGQIEMPKMQFVGGYPNEWCIFIDDLTDEEKSEITDIYGNSIRIQELDILIPVLEPSTE